MVNNGVFQRGKLQQRFFSKYTWKMAFVLSCICSGTLRTLDEPQDVGYSCDFSKNSMNPIFYYNTLDSISRSIESPIRLHSIEHEPSGRTLIRSRKILTVGAKMTSSGKLFHGSITQ